MKTFYNSPVGILCIQETEGYITGVKLVEKAGESENCPLLEKAVKQLEEYFAGERTQFDLPLKQQGTTFQKKAWDYLSNIPYGETVSYKQEAEAIGSPKGCRAVGSANGKNNLAIIVPCHRVVNAGGGLGGYAFGLEMKQWLLNMEKLYKQQKKMTSFLSDYKIILASNSPRRKELLSGLDLSYEIKTLPDIDESYPVGLKGEDIAVYISTQKANAYCDLIEKDTLLITADTLVLLNGKVYGKPVNEAEACQMLRNLSGKTHEVVTGVCLTTQSKQHAFGVSSQVRFAQLEESEIKYYVSHYKPLDKAGAYGIQEWIGYVAVEYISGSYFNIIGLPVQRLYQELKKF